MKLLTWVGKLFFAAVFVTTISVLTTWTMVDMYTQRILERFHLEEMQTGMQPVQVWNHLSERMHNMEKRTENEGTEEPSQSPEPPDESAPAEDRGPQRSEADVPADNRQDRQGTDAAPGAGPEAVPVWGQSGQTLQEQSGTSDRNASGDRLVISAEEFNRTKDRMSDEDKMKIFSLLVAKVPQEKLMAFSQLMEGGLTGEEISQIESEISQYLEEEEYRELVEILEKY